ncbi:LysR substrate-binding domain-containing protein [Paraburkholderia phymatum]|uniref:LysR substrate-binding domain-containing protein n=1 Tax=Paraburkholderia phymatum TaxID=148447 RepID=UPI00316DF644
MKRDEAMKPRVRERKLAFVNFNQLRSFYAVAQEMSFTRAAQLLHIGQPTLTVQVKQLEENYGVELFIRSPKGLQLSDVGKALFAIARQVFELEEQAVDLLCSTGEAVSGSLRVGTVGPFFVMKLLAKFAQRYPLVQVSIDSDNSDGVLRKILDSTTDVAITGNIVDDARLYSRHLGAHEILVFVNSGHPWAQLDSIKLAQLDGQKMILRERGSMTRTAFEKELTQHRVTPKVVMEVSRDAVREAVLEGLGIGVVSQAEYRPHDNLHVMRVADFPSFTHSYVVCLRSRRFAKAISAFVELAESGM